jgi:hypothetical protein
VEGRSGQRRTGPRWPRWNLRVLRVFLATSGPRRFAARLGKVTIIAALIVVLASLGAYQAGSASRILTGARDD